MGSDDFVCDLEISPGFCNKATSTIPCLVANSDIYSRSAGRIAVPKEHLLMMGMPVYSQQVIMQGQDAPVGHLKRYCRCPFASVLPTLSDREIVSMAGNGMHVAIIGALVGYVMATTKKLNSSAIDGESCCGDDGLDGGVHSSSSRISWEDALGSGRNPFLKNIARPLVSVGTDPLDGDLGVALGI